MPPKDYKKVDKATDIKDEFVRRAAQPYFDKGCTVYRGPDSDESKGKEKKNADFIITCASSKCDSFVVLIEVKSGTSSVEKAPSQLEKASGAAKDAGLIPAKVAKDQLAACFHAVVFATNKLVQPGKLKNEENQVSFGDRKKSPKLVTDPKDLPLP